VVLNNQPQGGFITRKPSPVLTAARSDNWFGNGFGFDRRGGWGSPYGDPRQRGGQYYDPRQNGQYYYQQQNGQYYYQQQNGQYYQRQQGGR
jgi:hypothetical protein